MTFSNVFIEGGGRLCVYVMVAETSEKCNGIVDKLKASVKCKAKTLNVLMASVMGLK